MPRTVKVALEGQATGLLATFRTVIGAARETNQELGKLRADHLNKIAFAAGATGLALLGVAGYAARAAMAFDRQMSEVAAVSGATGQEITRLRQAALQAGKDTAFTAVQAAQAEAELTKAGITTADVLSGALSGALSLASAGQMDLAEAATIAAQAMNVFQLRGKDVGHIADVLASAANVSAADMHGLGLGLQQVGLVAHQAGFSLEETVGLMAAMADRGLQGSDGATSLKTAIQRLVAPTAEAKDLMARLGLQIYDSQGNMVSAASVAGQLQHALRSMSDDQRNATLNTLFGSDAIRAATVLYSLGAVGVEHYTAAVDKQGAASAVAGKKMDNLAGDVKRLTGSLDTLAIQSGEGTNTGLRLLAQGAEKAVNAIADLPGPVQTTSVLLIGIGGASLLAAAGLLKVKQTVDGVMVALTAMGPQGERTAAGLSTIGRVGSRLGIVGIALFGVYEGYKALTDWIGRSARPVERDLDAMTRSLEEFARSAKVSGELAATFGAELAGLSRDLQVLSGYQARVTALQSNYLQTVRAGKGGPAPNAAGVAAAQRDREQALRDVGTLDEALAKLAGSPGGVNAAKIALQQLSQVSGESIDTLLARLPKYRAAIDGVTLANTGLAKGFGDAAANAHTLAGTLDAAVQAGQKLTDVLTQLSGGLATFLAADITARNAIDSLKQSLEANGHTLDLNTAKGRANEQGILDLRTAAINAAQAKYEETNSVGAASEVWDRYVAQLRIVLRAAGFTDTEINQLVKDLFTMPPSISTKIITPGLATAISGAQSLDQLLRSLNGRVSRAAVITTYYANQSGYRPAASYGRNVPQRWGGVTEHAQSGLLNQAQAYRAGPPLYAFAEPATGGELFAPRYGDMARTRGLVDYAVTKWWGGQVSWDRGGQSGDYASIAPAVAAAVRTALAGLTVTMDGQAVGRIQSLQADRYRRGG